MKVREAKTLLLSTLSKFYSAREASLIAKYLLEDLAKSKFLTDEKILSEENKIQLLNIIPQLERNVPWQYAIGQADFYGLKIRVSPAVLIPRPETEELVYRIIQDHKKSDHIQLLDVGTGSGCIPIAIKKNLPGTTVYALDVSDQALDLAKQTAADYGLQVEFLQCDILDEQSWVELPQFDVIVSNPPYIPYHEKDRMPDQVIDHEPGLALFVSDDDPLLFYRKIGVFGLEKLRPGGRLYFEINEYRSIEVVNLLNELGYLHISVEKDMQGKNRMITAKC